MRVGAEDVVGLGVQVLRLDQLRVTREICDKVLPHLPAPEGRAPARRLAGLQARAVVDVNQVPAGREAA